MRQYPELTQPSGVAAPIPSEPPTEYVLRRLYDKPLSKEELEYAYDRMPVPLQRVIELVGDYRAASPKPEGGEGPAQRFTSAENFWREYYKEDSNFKPSESACEFAEAYADRRAKEILASPSLPSAAPEEEK